MSSTRDIVIVIFQINILIDKGLKVQFEDNFLQFQSIFHVVETPVSQEATGNLFWGFLISCRFQKDFF